MSGPYTAALEDLRRWRDHVNFLIASLETIERGTPGNHAGAAAAPVVGTEPPMVGVRPTPARPRAPTPELVRETAPKPAADRRAPALEKPTVVTGDVGEKILAAIKKAGGSMAPGELASALRLNRATLRVRTAPLLSSGKLIATGVTASRRLSLPGTSAKEAP